MGCEVFVFVAFLCILQFGVYQAENEKGEYVIKLRMPNQSLRNPPPYQNLNQPPYAYNRQNSNGCNSCQNLICNQRCNPGNNNRLVKIPKHPISITVPGANGTSTKIILNKFSKGKEKIEVIVTVTPKGNKTTSDNPSVKTSSNSTATKNEYGERLTADTTAYENGNDSNSNVNVEVIVDDTDPNAPSDQELQSEIIANNGQGDRSISKTQAKIEEKPANKASNATPGTGKPTQNTTSSDKPADKKTNNMSSPSNTSSSPDKDQNTPSDKKSSPNTTAKTPAAPPNDPSVTDNSSVPDKKQDPTPEGEPKSPSTGESPNDGDKPSSTPSSASAASGAAAAADNNNGAAASTGTGATANIVPSISSVITTTTTTITEVTASAVSKPEGITNTTATGVNTDLSITTSGGPATSGTESSTVIDFGKVTSPSIGATKEPAVNLGENIIVSNVTTSSPNPGDGSSVLTIMNVRNDSSKAEDQLASLVQAGALANPGINISPTLSNTNSSLNGEKNAINGLADIPSIASNASEIIEGTVLNKGLTPTPTNLSSLVDQPSLILPNGNLTTQAPQAPS